MTARTRTTTERRPTCPQCKTRFRTRSKTAKFCNTSCRTTSHNIAHHVKQVAGASTSPFFYELARQAIRARTIQIYHHFDQKQLEDLYDVYSSCQKMNAYGLRKSMGEDPFELSHIAPVRGKTSVGLFRADNLVIAPMALNRSHGTNHYSGGASLPHADILPRFAVSKDDSVSEVVQRIIQLIGKDVVQAVVQSRKIKPSERQKHYSWLIDNLDPANPDHTEHLKTIETASARILADIRRQLEGKKPADDFRKHLEYLDDTSSLLAEWQRIGNAYRPELLPALERIRFLRANIASTPFLLDLSFDAIDTRLVFDMLHGKPVHTVTSIIDVMYAKVMASPTYFLASRALQSVAAKPLQAPLNVTESFLEDMDDDLPYVALDALYTAPAPLGHDFGPVPF